MRTTRKKRQTPIEVAKYWCNAGKDPPGFQIGFFEQKGRGIRSVIKRSKGEFLLQYAGEVISAEEGNRREFIESTGYRFFCRDFCIDATEESDKLGRLVNHGNMKKERNSIMKFVEPNNLCLFAARDIEEGEELLYDYGVKTNFLPWSKQNQQAGMKSLDGTLVESDDTCTNASIEMDGKAFGKLVFKANSSTNGCSDPLESGGIAPVEPVEVASDNLSKPHFHYGDEVDPDDSAKSPSNLLEYNGEASVEIYNEAKYKLGFLDLSDEASTKHDTMIVSGDTGLPDDNSIPVCRDPVDLENKASSCPDSAEPDNEALVYHDDNAMIVSDDTGLPDDNSIPVCRDPVDLENKASSCPDSAEPGNEALVDPDDNAMIVSDDTGLPDDNSIPVCRDPVDLENKASSCPDSAEPDNEALVYHDDNAMIVSDDTGLPDDNSIPVCRDPVDLENKASSCPDSAEPGNEALVDPDDNAMIVSDDTGLPDDNSIPVCRDPVDLENKASSCPDSAEPDNEALVDPDDNAMIVSDDTGLPDDNSIPVCRDPVDLENKASSCPDSAEPDNEALVYHDDNAMIVSDDTGLPDDNSIPVCRDPVDLENKASSCPDSAEPDNEALVYHDDNAMIVSDDTGLPDDNSIPVCRDPVDLENKASSCPDSAEPDNEALVYHDDNTMIVSDDTGLPDDNSRKPSCRQSVTLENKTSSCPDPAEPDNEALVDLDDNTPMVSDDMVTSDDNSIKLSCRESVTLEKKDITCHGPLEPGDKSSQVQHRRKTIFSDDSVEANEKFCSSEYTSRARSRQLKQHDNSFKRKRCRESSVYGERFEKRLKSRVQPPRSSNGSYTGNAKKPVACVIPNIQTRVEQEHDLVDDCLTDDLESFDSSGSEYVPESSEEEDDDYDDNKSDIFPLLDSTHKNKNVDNRSLPRKEIPQSETSELEKNSEVTIQQSEKSELEENGSKRKTYFKNISVEVYESSDGKRNYEKTDYCCFCKHSLTSKISPHLLAVHGQESEVMKISGLEINSRERKMALQKLQKEGNYYHNLEVLKNGEGTLIVIRRPKEKVCASEYLPCEYCLGFYHEKHLWTHVSGCYFRNDAVDSSKNYVRNGRIMLMPFIIRGSEEKDKLDQVITKMKETKENPGLRDVCMEDELIREFGMHLIQRLGTAEEQRRKDEDGVRTKLRCVARLLKKLNEAKIIPQPLSSYISARDFNAVASAVKELYRESDSPQLAITLGHYLKQICLLKASLAIQEEDDRKKRDANNFQEMFSAHWNSKVTAVANRTQRLRALNSNTQIPCTEDLIKLKNYVQEQIKTHMKNKTPTYSEYVRLTQLLIVRIAVFNKRRISEVDELSVADYEKRVRGNDVHSNSEIVQSLEFSERALLKRMEMLEVRGKSTRKIRKVFILLSEDMIQGIDHILSTRIHAGVEPKNKYVFARTSASPQDGCTAMREIASDCPGLSNPDLIRTRLLRKYLATTTQIMDMTGEELKLVADHMGHSVAIHTDIYRLQSSVLERTKVARALVALEEGKLKNFNGRSLSSITLDELPKPVAEEDNMGNEPEESDGDGDDLDDEPLCNDDDFNQPSFSTDVEKTHCTKSRGIKRKRWTKEEEKELMNAFSSQISNRRNVTTADIRTAKKKYKTLSQRSEAVIRSKINNIILGKTDFNLQ